MLRERGAAPPTAGERPSRAALEERLRLRVQVMLDVLIGPPPSLHGTLMCREMADPSEALPVIVDEFIRPMTAEMTAIVAQIEPGLTPAALERVVLSIIGQVVHWRVAMPALLLMRGERQYPKDLAVTLAEHITAFSLGGMRAVARATEGSGACALRASPARARRARRLHARAPKLRAARGRRRLERRTPHGGAGQACRSGRRRVRRRRAGARVARADRPAGGAPARRVRQPADGDRTRAAGDRRRARGPGARPAAARDDRLGALHLVHATSRRRRCSSPRACSRPGRTRRT